MARQPAPAGQERLGRVVTSEGTSESPFRRGPPYICTEFPRCGDGKFPPPTDNGKRPAEHIVRIRRADEAWHAGNGQAGRQRWGSRARRSSSLAPGSMAGRRVSTSRR